MRWNKGWVGVLAAAGLVLPGMALAANDEANPAPMMGSQAESGKTVHGQLTQLLKSDHEILLSDRAAPLVVDQKAKISRDGKDVSFDDLKPGDDIRASFDATGGKVISIDAQSKGKMGNQPEEKGEPSGSQNY